MSPSQSKDTKTYTKGSYLYRAGEKADRIFIVQSGLVSVTSLVADQMIQLFQAVTPQLVGDEALGNKKFYVTSAIAVNDTTVLEIRMVDLPQLISAGTPVLRLLAQGMVRKQVAAAEELIRAKLKSDPTPCPAEKVVKLFATIFHVASYTGKTKDEKKVVNWPAFRKYCQRVFGESPVRLEHAIYLLVDLGYAQLEMVKSETDPEAPEELGFVHFVRLEELKAFSEFFRNAWKTEETRELLSESGRWSKTLSALRKMLESAGEDGKSALESEEICLSVPDVSLYLETQVGMPASQDPFKELERMGLAIQRKTTKTDEQVKFRSEDLSLQLRHQKFIEKIAVWNAKGKIDLPAPQRPQGRDAA